MNNSNIPPKFPYDDELMTYDYNSHRYVLTEHGVESEHGMKLSVILNPAGDADPSTLPRRKLKRVSDAVYNWLYSDTMNSSWIEYILATFPPLRERILEMLQAQLMYMLNSGDLSIWSGVNIAEGTVMDISTLRGIVRLSPVVEDIGTSIVPELGYCLKYAGALPTVPSCKYRRGY